MNGSASLEEIFGQVSLIKCPECGGEMMGSARTPATVRCPDCVAKRSAEAEEAAAATSEAARSVPVRYAWAIPGSPLTKLRVMGTPEELAKARAWTPEPGACLTLVGGAGAGKTSLGCVILRRSKGGMFVHAFRLGVARIQHRAGDGEPKTVDDAMQSPFVLLDDVGAERNTATNAVPDVIFERHAEGLPTIITTGLDVEQVAKIYSDGVARRMFEAATVVRLGKPVTK